MPVEACTRATYAERSSAYPPREKRRSERGGEKGRPVLVVKTKLPRATVSSRSILILSWNTSRGPLPSLYTAGPETRGLENERDKNVNYDEEKYEERLRKEQKKKSRRDKISATPEGFEVT